MKRFQPPISREGRQSVSHPGRVGQPLPLADVSPKLWLLSPLLHVPGRLSIHRANDESSVDKKKNLHHLNDQIAPVASCRCQARKALADRGIWGRGFTSCADMQGV